MGIKRELKAFVREAFKTSLRVFLNALKLSPNAQGYVRGSVTEVLLMQELTNRGYEVQRIREKWEGKKHAKHHGDFYVRKKGSDRWIVLESKGIKSNTEKWHKLYNYDRLVKFLFAHSEKIPWINCEEGAEEQIKRWISSYLPRFDSDFRENLYDYEEITKYSRPRSPTLKSRAVDNLRHLNREEIAAMIDERIAYLSAQMGVLETHFVAGAGSGNRTQATPRKDEFGLVAVDIFLRYHKHLFLYANPRNLASSGADSEHLQQNYVIGFVFPDSAGNHRYCHVAEFTDDFDEAYNTVRTEDTVNEEDRQVDNRNLLMH